MYPKGVTTRLSHIFSCVEVDNRGRFLLYSRLFEICNANEQQFLMVPYLNKLETLMPWTALSLQEKVDILKGVIEVTKQESKSAKLLDQIRRFLRIFKDCQEAEVLAHQEQIQDLLLIMIENDELLFELGEILTHSSVQTVLGQSQGLRALFEGIVSGDAKNAGSLFKNSKQYVTGTSLDEEAIKNKIQYTQMVALADKHKKMSFNEIQEKLDCSLEDIEPLFINAIELGFLAAVIDQNSSAIYFG